MQNILFESKLDWNVNIESKLLVREKVWINYSFRSEDKRFSFNWCRIFNKIIFSWCVCFTNTEQKYRKVLYSHLKGGKNIKPPQQKSEIPIIPAYIHNWNVECQTISIYIYILLHLPCFSVSACGQIKTQQIHNKHCSCIDCSKIQMNWVMYV